MVEDRIEERFQKVSGERGDHERDDRDEPDGDRSGNQYLGQSRTPLLGPHLGRTTTRQDQAGQRPGLLDRRLGVRARR